MESCASQPIAGQLGGIQLGKVTFRATRRPTESIVAPTAVVVSGRTVLRVPGLAPRISKSV